MSTTFTDLARDLGLGQDEVWALIDFSGPIGDRAREDDSDEISDDDADFIRTAWAIGSQATGDALSAEVALRCVESATRQRARSEDAVEQDAQAQAVTIRVALDAGVSALALAAASGLSRGRIYQIRDRRR